MNKSASIYKRTRKEKLGLIKKDTYRTRFPETLTDQRIVDSNMNEKFKTKGEVKNG